VIRVKKWWMPLLIGALLMGTLVGVVGARPNARPHEVPASWQKLTVPVQNCIPQEETMNYRHQADYLQCQSGSCLFFCPVTFPTEQAVTVKRLTLFAYDNDGTIGHMASANLYKINPQRKNDVLLASVLTTTSPADAQVVRDSSIDNALIRRTQGPFLTVSSQGATVKVYGVRIFYTR
jgi:hypothetical protein